MQNHGETNKIERKWEGTEDFCRLWENYLNQSFHNFAQKLNLLKISHWKYIIAGFISISKGPPKEIDLVECISFNEVKPIFIYIYFFFCELNGFYEYICLDIP